MESDEMLDEVAAKAEDSASEVKVAAEEVKAAAEAAAQETAQAGQDAAETIRRMVKDAGERVERLPVPRHVRKVAREVATQMKQGAQDLEKNPLAQAAHKVLLAGIGAAALAQDEVEDFVNRLVERGSIAEADGKRMVKEVLEERRAQMSRAGDRAQDVAAGVSEGSRRFVDDLEQRIEGVLTRMNIPSKDEIEALSAKITSLTKKVDELKKSE